MALDRSDVFVARKLPIDLAEVFAGFSFSVFPHDRPPTREELLGGASGCRAVITLLSDRVDEEFLESCPSVVGVANYAVGYDNIDINACRERGVVVTNTPDVLTESTAELTFALMLSCARRLREGEMLLRGGHFSHWSPSLLLGTQLSGRTLGIYGLGRIGRAVASRAEAFGMHVIHTGRGSGVTFEELLERSDVISIHAPLNADTAHAFDRTAFSQMKPYAILINTARGPIVKEADLVWALETGEIAGAGLDVFEDEPRVHPALIKRDDVVLLPHLGSATQHARRRMAEIACENALAILGGVRPPNPVGEWVGQ